MSVKVFTENDIKILEQNPYVKNVNKKGITYTKEFKCIFISKYQQGNFPSTIFTECEFDIQMLGKDRYKSAGKRWRAAYNKIGELGLVDARKGNSGRTNKKELSIEVRYERLQTKNRLLEAENELLKKIKMAEMRLINKKKSNHQAKNTYCF